MKIDFPKLAASVIACELAGVAGSVFTVQSIPTWYAALQKPAFSPPNWVFAPVWTTLYLLMGIALYLVWENGLQKKEVRVAVCVFGLQLFLNALWSFLFFGLRSPGLAFVEIILLWLSIAATTALFYRISKTAGLLLTPYVVWATFAAALNYYVWMLNA
ncbi:MAG: TspO/MBR family protein [Candidatus Micrarchaeia archaeon]|jgi:tryptophan-rich sensory protein